MTKGGTKGGREGADYEKNAALEELIKSGPESTLDRVESLEEKQMKMNSSSLSR